jgi:hypothetical protein
VDLGPTKDTGQPPETEDRLFDIRKAVRVRDTTPEEFWSTLVRVAKRTLADIFGPELAPCGPHSCGTDRGKGRVSLGCLIVRGPLDLAVRPRAGEPGQVRLFLRGGPFDLNLSVTDIRLYGPDHATPDRAAVDRAARRLHATGEFILSVGLTRPFAKAPSEPAVHWLQVNNLHFADAPLWQGRPPEES